MNDNAANQTNALPLFHNAKPRGGQVPVTMFPVDLNVNLKSGVTILFGFLLLLMREEWAYLMGQISFLYELNC